MQERSFAYREGKTTASKSWPSLPVQLTSFVGREQEIAEVCELLSRPEIRLLTLIGTGGVGKTRLSLQVATRLSKDFSNHVCVVSLMEISDPALVIPAIAKTLGLEEQANQPLLDLLKLFLREKHMLLLLDNFEQVIEAAPTLANLLGVCSGLKILVTSRAVLQISGEYMFFVAPLALPNLALLPKKEELLQYPAIMLFLERTRAILPHFSLTKENSRIIAEICIHLDGLPLAIELAVPRLKLLSPQTLLKRLDHRFQVLTHGMRDAPGRHQTFHNTLEWSYHLLNPKEQQLFRSLSIFVGGCTLQAIEAIWGLAGYQEKEQVLEGVSSLFDKSMLYRSMQKGEEPRLLMLRTLHEYGRHHLILTGELEQLQWAHARYYLALAEEAAPQLKGPHLEQLRREHDNLYEALCFLTARGEEESLVISRELGNQRGIAYILSALGEIAYMMGDFVQARECYEEGLMLLMQCDDKLMIAIYLEGLARVAVAQNEAIWAIYLLSAAQALRQIMGASMIPVETDANEEALATLHHLLDDHAFAAAWAEGQAMSPAQAMAAHSLSTQFTSPAPLEKPLVISILSPHSFLAPLEKPPVISILSPHSLHNNLTPRERDVLHLVAEGLSDAEVAERLVISPRTVNFHLTSIYRKLQVSSRSAATRYAIEFHLF